MERSKFSELEKKINYTFKNKELLKKALTHKSFVKETRNSNEVLEFLGDSVVNLFLAEKLISLFPYLNEGDLSKLRALFSSRKFLFKLANEIELGKYLYLGKSEVKEKGWEKVNITSSAFEALVGAIKLDGGIEKAMEFLEKLFSKHLSRFEGKIVRINDYKSEVQEEFQREGKIPPEYRIVEEKGPDHQKEYIVEMVDEEGKRISSGKGKTKKEAEQESAKKFIKNSKDDSVFLFYDDFFVEIKDG